MGSIINNLMGMTDSKLNDQVIANSTDFAIKASANAYLAACLSASTPEFSRLCAENLNRKLEAHHDIMALILKNKWAQPYASPEEQMTHAYKQANEILGKSQG